MSHTSEYAFNKSCHVVRVSNKRDDGVFRAEKIGPTPG